MEFQLSYVKTWKMILWRCCAQYASKFGKISSGHRTGKGPFSFQSQRKPMPKNAQTTTQLHSSHTLVIMLKILQARLQQYMNHELAYVPACFMNFHMFQRNKRSICQHLLDHEKRKRVPENIYFCFFHYAKAFVCVDHNKLWKTLKELGEPDPLTCLLRNLYAGQEATVRTGHGTTDWFQIGKVVCQGCILSPCFFNLYAEYIMRKPGWMKHKLESRLPGEISITSDTQKTPPL